MCNASQAVRNAVTAEINALVTAGQTFTAFDVTSAARKMNAAIGGSLDLPHALVKELVVEWFRGAGRTQSRYTSRAGWRAGSQVVEYVPTAATFMSASNDDDDTDGDDDDDDSGTTYQKAPDTAPLGDLPAASDETDDDDGDADDATPVVQVNVYICADGARLCRDERGQTNRIEVGGKPVELLAV